MKIAQWSYVPLFVVCSFLVSATSTAFGQDLVISEFLASNSTILVDDDGDSSDVIEIHNRGATVADVGGWYLTDDPAVLEKWRIPGPGEPATQLSSDEFLLVFSSGKDRISPDAELHTNFRLRSDGEYLALVRPDGTVAHAYSPSYPRQLNDYSYGISDALGGALRYFPAPTLGTPNADAGFAGFVEDTQFSIDRGFHDAPLDVEITTATPDANIYYTLDGAVPVPGESSLYQGPIHLSTTTFLRAAAFKADHVPTNVDTQTYIFLDDVLMQNGAGLPQDWDGFEADYAMDPNVVDDPAYRDTIRDDLKSIPSLSLVMNHDDLFGETNGIYMHPRERGNAWERPCSMEFVDPLSDDNGVHVNCGVRIWGSGSRSHQKRRKKSFRLLFKRQYGPARLNFRLFPDWQVESFNTIILRAQGDWSWDSEAGASQYAQYLRDAWTRYTARDMGKLTTQSTHVHLYINGLYWGLYNAVERPDASFMEEHFGGDETDYDAVNATVGNLEATDGSLDAWNAVIARARAGLASTTGYAEVEALVDVPDLIQYMIGHFYTGGIDWPGANGNNMRVAGAPNLGIVFKSFLWDMEQSLRFEVHLDNVNTIDTTFNSPATIHAFLAANEEYRVLFGDLVHRHFHNGGALTPEKTTERLLERAAVIHGAIVGESARWGDRHRNPPYTRDADWLLEQSRLVNTYFPVRTGIVLEQLKTAGLFPLVEAPSFSIHGGRVASGVEVFLSAPAGRLFYTTDGSDPRLPGGGIASGAIEFDRADSTLITSRVVSAGDTVRMFVPSDDSLGRNWTQVEFDDSSWIESPTGVGYETFSGYEDLILTDVVDTMYEKSSSLYLRMEFSVNTPVSVLSLDMKYDDGFVAYLNGELVASVNAPDDLTAASRATATHSDSQARIFQEFALTDHVGFLRQGENVLAIHALNRRSTDADMLIVPEVRIADFQGSGIVIETTTTVKSRALLNGNWSALNEATFVPGETLLRVTEIMYHPAAVTQGDSSPEGDFEFIEMQNIGDAEVNLQGIAIAGAIEFDFSTSDVTHLGPQEFIILVKNLEAFGARYETDGVAIAGEFDGQLSNGGETVTVQDPLGDALQSFAYDDAWYPSTDGTGHSLVIVDASLPIETWNLGESWHPSTQPGGSPGNEDIDNETLRGFQLPGDANQDSYIDIADAVSLLLLLFRPAGRSTPCDGATVADGGNISLLDHNGDETVDGSDTVSLLLSVFSTGPGHIRGTQCTLFDGCPNTCGEP